MARQEVVRAGEKRCAMDRTAPGHANESTPYSSTQSDERVEDGTGRTLQVKERRGIHRIYPVKREPACDSIMSVVTCGDDVKKWNTGWNSIDGFKSYEFQRL